MRIARPRVRNPRLWIALALFTIAGTAAGFVTGLQLLPTRAATETQVVGDCPVDAEYLFVEPTSLDEMVSKADLIIKGQVLSRTTVYDTRPGRGRTANMTTPVNVHTVKVLETLEGTTPAQTISLAPAPGQCLEQGQTYYFFLASTGRLPDEVFVDDPAVAQSVVDYGFSVYGPSNAILVSDDKVFPEEGIGYPRRFEGAEESQFRIELNAAISRQTRG